MVHSAAIYAGGNYGVIEELYIEPEFHYKRIGRELLEKVVSLAAEGDGHD
ncbi:GNAT family N-acetyltransferase [Microbulbifer sp. SSSA002]